MVKGKFAKGARLPSGKSGSVPSFQASYKPRAVPEESCVAAGLWPWSAPH